MLKSDTRPNAKMNGERMSQGISRHSRMMVFGAYLFLTLLVFWSAVDLVTTGWPMRFGSVEWRYGFMGLLTAYLHTPVLALFLAMGLSLFLGHRTALRVLAMVCLLAALGLFIVLILFPLDVIQLRSVTPPENLRFFQTGAILSELKHFTSFLVLILLGAGGWRTGGRMQGKVRASEGSGLTAEVLKAQKREQ